MRLRMYYVVVTMMFLSAICLGQSNITLNPTGDRSIPTLHDDADRIVIAATEAETAPLCVALGEAHNGIHHILVGPVSAKTVLENPRGKQEDLTIHAGCDRAPAASFWVLGEWGWVSDRGQYYNHCAIMLTPGAHVGSVTMQLNAKENDSRGIGAQGEAGAMLISEYALAQNFPNPFNPTTNISFDLAEDNLVTLTVFNTAGQQVSQLIDRQSMKSGRYTLQFDGADLPSGVYFYRLTTGHSFTATQKMLLIK